MGEKHRKPCRQRKEAASQVKHRGLRRIYVFFLTLFVLAAVFMGMTAAEYNTRKSDLKMMRTPTIIYRMWYNKL